ncbi:hypothetical protein GCM10012278_73360 [Nonomuraea glycinis]|uniref:Uncharacterized protein n=1 Tax=Nonomuraea glycinis TaxID=2047744 RepID=A0A918EAB7_9ACTN|nr:hypothetical protein GCM10012278_73360 [Nonomuraea glycinis]
MRSRAEGVESPCLADVGVWFTWATASVPDLSALAVRTCLSLTHQRWPVGRWFVVLRQGMYGG